LANTLNSPFVTPLLPTSLVEVGKNRSRWKGFRKFRTRFR